MNDCKDKLKCWRIYGCPFNSNNSFYFMKCEQEGYSVIECEKEHGDKWRKIDSKKYFKQK